MFTCTVCCKGFSRIDNLRRHTQQNHHDTSFQHHNVPPEHIPNHQATGNDITFQHPFTMMVTGPTACGKTQWVKNLLTSNMIQPPPQRIIFLYRRWQPLYDVMGPNVEFMNEIPPNLDKDNFINPNIRNLLIIDDYMTVVCKDKRVTDLFTEGSHHRNLSLIVMQQNIYYGKDPTQRRNSQYIVLFKNPADQTLILTLARQMYPNNCQYFLQQWQDATSQPYGHMVIDLKPSTLDHERLKSNIFENISPYNPPLLSTPSVNNRVEMNDYTYIANEPNLTSEGPQNPLEMARPQNPFQRSLYSCNDCGMILNTSNDLQNHVRNWCSESSEDMNEVPASPLLSNTKAFKVLVDKVLSDNKETFMNILEEYRRAGYSKMQAQLKTFGEVRHNDMKTFAQYYRQIIMFLIHLQQSPLHNKIMATALILNHWMTPEKAAEEAIAKHMDIKEVHDIFDEHSNIEIPASSDSDTPPTVEENSDTDQISDEYQYTEGTAKDPRDSSEGENYTMDTDNTSEDGSDQTEGESSTSN